MRRQSSSTSRHTPALAVPTVLKAHGMKIGAVAAIGILGVSLLASTRAATVTLSVEAESGSLAGKAATVAAASASGGSAVTFGGGAAGGTGAVSCDQAGIQKLVDSVSATTIEANLRKLVQDDSKPTPNESISRHVSSPGNKIKTDWARQQYVSYGLEDASQQFSSGGYSLTNVVGRLAGSDPNTLYAVSGHIDSISQSPKTVAPGAEDDGSGTVAAMEAGRVLKAFQPCMKASLDFVGFNDEEENMNGSPAYINAVKSKTFKGMYNLDMVGYTPNGECFINFYNSNTRDKPLYEKVGSVNTKYNIGMKSSNQSYNSDDVDAWQFWNKNLPSVYGADCATDSYPDYHKTSDSVKNINFTQMAKVTKLMVASLAELSLGQ